MNKSLDYSFYKNSPEYLKKHMGTMRQLAGIRKSVLDDGKGRGVRVADIKNGSGLEFSVLLDRGFDIVEASYKSVPLAFMSRVGHCHPAFYDPRGIGWLRSWPGGLMTGCGLTTVGAPDEFEGEEQPLHGRLSHTPAENCASSEMWNDGEYELSVTGEMRESRPFFENMVITRTIKTVMGDDRIVIEDKVENQGFSETNFMLLYHINLGYPVLSKDSIVEAPEHTVTPRDETAAAGGDSWMKCQVPTAAYKEQCFYHDLPAGNDGMSRITLRNPELGFGVEVAFRKAELPYLTQWKQMGEGTYAMGLEPANCHVQGISKEKEMGTLRSLKPGEIVNTRVEISIV